MPPSHKVLLLAFKKCVCVCVCVCVFLLYLPVKVAACSLIPYIITSQAIYQRLNVVFVVTQQKSEVGGPSTPPLVSQRGFAFACTPKG